MIHKLEIYCWSDDEYDTLLTILKNILTDYELQEEKQHAHIIVNHHHFDFVKKEKKEWLNI